MCIVQHRRMLRIYRQKRYRKSLPGRKELRLGKFGIEYGEGFHLNPKTNFLSYQLRSLRRQPMDKKVDGTGHVCMRLIRGSLPPARVVYDKVGVVPLRAHYNIFHFAEGLNTLVRFLMRYGNRFPVGMESAYDA